MSKHFQAHLTGRIFLASALFVTSITITSTARAAEPDAWFGFGYGADVSVFLNLEAVTVRSVYKDSEAARAGVVVGDSLIEIDGCQIPGCGAFKAKGLMEKTLGEVGHFKFTHSNGGVYSAALTAIATPPAKTP